MASFVAQDANADVGMYNLQNERLLSFLKNNLYNRRGQAEGVGRGRTIQQSRCVSLFESSCGHSFQQGKVLSRTPRDI
jgi:hypothetical protein